MDERAEAGLVGGGEQGRTGRGTALGRDVQRVYCVQRLACSGRPLGGPERMVGLLKKAGASWSDAGPCCFKEPAAWASPRCDAKQPPRWDGGEWAPLRSAGTRAAGLSAGEQLLHHRACNWLHPAETTCVICLPSLQLVLAKLLLAWSDWPPAGRVFGQAVGLSTAVDQGTDPTGERQTWLPGLTVEDEVKLRQAAETRRLSARTTAEEAMSRGEERGEARRGESCGVQTAASWICLSFMLFARAGIVCIPVARFHMILVHAARSPTDHPLDGSSSLLWPAPLVGARALPHQRLNPPCPSLQFTSQVRPMPRALSLKPANCGANN